MEKALRIAYSCHDSFPSFDTNTQQIFWTLTEVARLGARVDLLIPSVAASPAADARATIAAHYGAPGEPLPQELAIVAAGRWPATSWLEKARFDWRVPHHLNGESHDFVWTRDIVAAAACARAGLPFVFETYRPDIATRARFAPWRSICLTSRSLRGVVLHSRVAASAFIDAGAPSDRCLVAHNGFAPSLMKPALGRDEARRQLGIPDGGPLIVYAGHSGPEKGIDALIRIAARAPQLRFLIVGIDPDSEQARSIERATRAAGAANLLLRSRVLVSEVAPYLYAADCLIIPPTEGPLRRFRGTVLPMKLFTYLAAGRPILAPRLPDIEEMLTDGATARLVQPDDPGQAATALVDLINDPALQDRLSRNTLAAAGDYTWAARARKLMEFFERMLVQSVAVALAAWT